MKTHAAITTSPVATSVLLGDIAHFSCSGSGLTVLWLINGISAKVLGVDFNVSEVDGVITTSLPIPGTVENDNTSVQCIFVIDVNNDVSEQVYLTVLGVGAPPSVTFSYAQSQVPCIQWEKPFSSADVTDLWYTVSVAGPDKLDLGTTSDTYYCLELAPCLEYSVTVTPYSTFPNYTGTSSNSTDTDTVPGESYQLEEVSSVEVMFGTDTCEVTFTCKLQAPNGAVCPNQSIKVVTKSYNNTVTTSHTQSINYSLIYNGTFVDITITGLERRKQYSSSIHLMDGKGTVIDEICTDFATYSIQEVKLHSSEDAAAINIDCIFAVNAPAQGCLVLFRDFSFRFSVTITRSGNALITSELVHISEALPCNMTYRILDVAVYDYYHTDQEVNFSEPALQLQENIVVFSDVETVKNISQSFVLITQTQSSCYSDGSRTIATATPSPVDSSPSFDTMLLLVVLSSGLPLVALLLATAIGLNCCLKKWKAKNADLKDVPVARNPCYSTVGSLGYTANKDHIYEVVHPSR